MIRIVYTRYWDDSMSTSEFRVSPHIDHFMSTYLTHTYTTSDLFLIRLDIRQSKSLNALLHDNRTFLKSLFKRVCEPKIGFTEESASELFYTPFNEQYKKKVTELKSLGIKDETPLGPEQSIHKLFVYSKMSVSNE